MSGWSVHHQCRWLRHEHNFDAHVRANFATGHATTASHTMHSVPRRLQQSSRLLQSQGGYLTCTTSTDQCHNLNALSAQFDAHCPQIKCDCTSVTNPCLPDGAEVATQCTRTVDNCASCSTCECELQCCTSECIRLGYGAAKGQCNAPGDKISDCVCSAQPTVPSPSPGPVGACSPGASGCACKQGQCDTTDATCVGGSCLVLGCVVGEVGCPCLSDNTCLGDLACRNNKCVFANPCAAPGNLGCQCTSTRTCSAGSGASCDATSRVCLNMRQFTCNVGDFGCWCRADGTCAGANAECVEVNRQGRKSCVFKGVTNSVPTAPTPPRIVPKCAVNQLRNRAATRCGVDPADCEANQPQLTCVAQVYALCEEFLQFEKCNSAHAIAGSCLAKCATSSASSTRSQSMQNVIVIIAIFVANAFV